MKRLYLTVVLMAVCSGHAWAQAKLSLPIRNAQANSVEQNVGKNPVLKLCSGTPPPSVESRDGSNSVATFVLPEDWVTTARTAFVVKMGEWKTIASRTGRTTHYRIYSKDGKTHMQGPVSTSTGNGVITLRSLDLIQGQPVFVNSFMFAE